MKKLNIIHTDLLDYYKAKQPITILKHFNRLKSKSNGSADLSFYNTISAVYSSRIEGSKLLVSDYLKIHNSGMNTTNKDYKQVNDLIKAYEFAQSRKLNLKNVLQSHILSTKTLIDKQRYRGQLRDKPVGVYNENGERIYVGCPVEILDKEMNFLFEDIKDLLDKELTYNEVFYFASMIHLCFVKIHPFADGNRRTARLLEKWFIAECLGKTAWKIQNEKLYQERIKSYYNALDIGKTYDTVNYNASYPFLKMLPMALKVK